MPKIFFSIKLQVEACKFIKKETLAQVFSCEFCEIFKKIFSYLSTLVYKVVPKCITSHKAIKVITGRVCCNEIINKKICIDVCVVYLIQHALLVIIMALRQLVHLGTLGCQDML